MPNSGSSQMTGDSDLAGHGVEVALDDFHAALEASRLQRLALDILAYHLPGDVATGPVWDALVSIREQITARELMELRRRGLLSEYAIISPINPLNPPGPEDMGRIAAAIRTLDDLGLIVQAA